MCYTRILESWRQSISQIEVQVICCWGSQKLVNSKNVKQSERAEGKPVFDNEQNDNRGHLTEEISSKNKNKTLCAQFPMKTLRTLSLS